MILRVQDEQVTFNVFKAIKHLNDNQTYFWIDDIDQLVYKYFIENIFEDPIEACIIQSKDASAEDGRQMECIRLLEARSPISRVYRSCFEELEKSSTPLPKLLIEDPPTLKLKPLSSDLKYIFSESSSYL